MNFFTRMFKKGKISPEDLSGKTTGELIIKATDGKLLVDGKATYELVNSDNKCNAHGA